MKPETFVRSGGDKKRARLTSTITKQIATEFLAFSQDREALKKALFFKNLPTVFSKKKELELLT